MLSRSGVLFFLMGMVWTGSMGQSLLLDRIEAVVGDKSILRSDISSRVGQYAQEGLPQEELFCAVLQDLIFEKLLLHQAALDSIVITEGQVDQELNHRLDYLLRQMGSESAFESFYGQTISSFRDQMRPLIYDLLMAQRMRNQLTANIQVTPAETREFFERFPKDSLPYFGTEVEVAQIIRYSKAGKEANDQARKKLRELRDRIRNGDNFATLARLYSQDPGSARQGGDLGFMNRSDLVPEFASAAYRLQTMEVSGIVESPFGLHLIQLMDRKGDQIRVRHILIRPEIQAEDLEQDRAFLDSIRSRIVQGELSFAQAAKEYSMDEQTRNNGGRLMNPNDANPRVSLELLDEIFTFVLDTLPLGGVSEPITYQNQQGRQGFRIIHYINRIPAHTASLEKDFPRIQEAARREKEAEVLETWMNKKIRETYIHITQAGACPELEGSINKEN